MTTRRTAARSPRVDGANGRQRGQGLVEFALVMPIFFLALCGLIDGARLVYLNSTLSQAAREAARVASVEAAWIGSTDPACGTVGGPVCPATKSVFEADLAAAANRMMTPFGVIPSGNVYVRCDATTPPTGNWTGDNCANTASGSLVSIRVVYTFPPITPIVGQILTGIKLSGSATMAIN